VTAAPPRRVAAVLFALFVVASGGAFFVTQRLKRSTPIVTRVYFHEWIGPRCGCDKRHVTLRFDLPRAQRVTVSLVNSAGEVVRTLADDRFASKGTQRFVWDGRGDNGVIVPDGSYRLRVGLRAEGRSVTAPRVLHVDTRPPRPKIVSVTPAVVMPGTSGASGTVRIEFKGPSNPPAVVRVWRTDAGKAAKVGTITVHRGRHSTLWDGLVNGKPAPEGSYAFSVTVTDHAGNRGSVPRRLPPTRRGAVRNDGVAVSYFSLAGPLVPVKPGAIARFTVGPLPRPVRWRLAQYSRGGAIRTGVSHGSTIAVRIPRTTDADVYSLSAVDASGTRRASWPLVVGNSGGAAPVLVVLPAMTWQGQNPVESTGDGWPDTLDAGGSVPLARGFLHGRPPASIASQIVPALAFLTHIRANFDLTTDVALAAGKTPGIAGHNGVLFAGTERWLTPKLTLQLRRFVLGGGTVASLGEDALRRGVDLRKGKLVDPTRRRRRDVFGERATTVTSPEAPLIVSQDKLGLFTGSDNFIGSFTRFERSDALDPKAALLTAAGRADAAGGQTKSDFVAYTLGKGLVIRAGSDQWAGALATSPEVANATRRMWTLLSR
jgi:flagellar hook assembly protein FlgD